MSSLPATRAGWIKYDDLEGPALQSSLWEPLDIGSGPLLESEAHTTIENGVLTIDIPKFRNFDASNQMLDNSKHVIFATQDFRLPVDGVGRFSVELKAQILGDGYSDYRHGFASLNVADRTGGTHMAFNLLSIGDRAFAEQEVLPVPGQEDPFTRVIEDPFFFSRAGALSEPDYRRCSIEIDRSLRPPGAARGCAGSPG